MGRASKSPFNFRPRFATLSLPRHLPHSPQGDEAVMEPNWYYARQGKQYGPVTENDLRAMLDRGDLRGNDLVWKKGSPDWVEVRSVPGMLGELEPIPEAPRSRKDRRDRDERVEPRREERSRPRDDREDDDYRDRDRGRGRDRYDDRDDPYDRVPLGPPVDVVGSLKRHFSRLLTWNLQKVEPTADEKETLSRSGITDETTQKYACWRRSVLWVTMGPTYLFALLAMISYFKIFEYLSVFGILAHLMLIVNTFALPTGALLAALNYDRLGRSNFWLTLGVVASFLFPILIALIPSPWLVKDRLGTGGSLVVFGLYITLIPAVLAILPGVARGCLRIKSILPASVLAGWGYVLSVPLQILLSLVIFIVIYQLLASGLSATPLLLLGALCWFASPAVYLFRTDLLTRPMNRNDLRSLLNLNMVASVATLVGIFLVVIFLFVGSEGRGRTIMGFGSDSAITPFNLDLHRFWIEYLSRSLLMAVLFSDLLLRVNLAIWRQERSLASTELAQEYNHAMENLSSLVAKGDPLLDRAPADESQPQRTLTVDPDDDPPARRPKSSRRSNPPPEMSPDEPPRDGGFPKPF